jgi:hypothetical protein
VWHFYFEFLAVPRWNGVLIWGILMTDLNGIYVPVERASNYDGIHGVTFLADCHCVVNWFTQSVAGGPVQRARSGIYERGSAVTEPTWTACFEHKKDWNGHGKISKICIFILFVPLSHGLPWDLCNHYRYHFIKHLKIRYLSF